RSLGHGRDRQEFECLFAIHKDTRCACGKLLCRAQLHTSGQRCGERKNSMWNTERDVHNTCGIG
ncbi:MAG: hypothetical protein ACPIOQ_55610, partial [Promethearchaeia archaeon]